MNITPHDLESWACQEKSRRTLPELIRRLIHETVPAPSRIDFQTGDPSSLKGFDGQTSVEVGTRWVPSGAAVWELSCRKDVRSKAEEDFRSREKYSEEYKASTSFVFATPRSWNNRDDWAAGKKGEGGWKDVIALDGCNLLDWLSEAWVAQIWLEEQLNQRRNNFKTPDFWWERWAGATQPCIPYGLATARYGNPGSQLMTLMRNNSTDEIRIAGESRDEVIAFVVATLAESDEWDLFDRTIIVPSLDISLPPRGSVRRFVICETDTGENSALSSVERNLLIRPVPHGMRGQDVDIELSYVPSRKFHEVLKDSKIESADAWADVQDAGCSLSAYRRRHASDEEARWPAWSRRVESGSSMLAFGLAGAWEEGHWDDLSAIAELANKDTAKTKVELGQVLTFDDSPIVQIGPVHSVVSPVDVLHILGEKFDERLIDRFYLLAEKVLGETENFALFNKQSQEIEINNCTVRAYSEHLPKGIGNSLGVLATYGARICGSELGKWALHKNRVLVQALMTGCTKNDWYSRRNFMGIFAECDPTTFLDSLENELRTDEKNICCIMDNFGGTVRGECLRLDLLWALESLAHDRRLYSRVAQVLAKLIPLERSDQYATTAYNSLLTLFHPDQVLSGKYVEDIQDALDKVCEQNRSLGVDICMKLLSGKVMRNRPSRPRPRYLRIGGGDVMEKIPRVGKELKDVGTVSALAKNTLLGMNKLNTSEVKLALDSFCLLDVEVQRWLDREVQYWREVASDIDLALVRDQAGRQLSWVEESAKSKPTIANLRRIANSVEPKEPGNRHKWLFDQEYIPEAMLNDEYLNRKMPHERTSRRLKEARTKAIEEVVSDGGFDALMQFVQQVEYPYIVGAVMAEAASSLEELDEVVYRATAVSPGVSTRSFLQGIFDNTQSHVLFQRYASDKYLNNEQIRQIVKILPGDPMVWRTVEHECDEAAVVEYWTSVCFRRGMVGGEEDQEHCIEMLLSVGRPLYTAHLFSGCIRSVPARVWFSILSAIVKATANTKEKRYVPLDSGVIIEVLNWMDESGQILELEVVNLEIAFLWPLMDQFCGGAGPRRKLLLHRLMAREPGWFVHVLDQAYGDGGNVGAEAAVGRVGKVWPRLPATGAITVLNKWSILPGMRSDGTLDQEAFVNWYQGTLRLAVEVGLQKAAEDVLGRACANGFAALGVTVFCPWIYEFFENRVGMEFIASFIDSLCGSGQLEFFNRSEGGAPQRSEAKDIRQLAHELGRECPKIAQALEWSAGRYGSTAQGLDDHRTQQDRRPG